MVSVSLRLGANDGCLEVVEDEDDNEANAASVVLSDCPP
jgi:hypothetical protein